MNDYMIYEYNNAEENFKLAMLKIYQETILINRIDNEILNESISDKINSLKERVIKFFKTIRDKLKEIFDAFKNKIKNLRNEYHKKKILYLTNKITKTNESVDYFNESTNIKFPQIYFDAAKFFSNEWDGNEIYFDKIKKFIETIPVKFGKLSMDFIEGELSNNLERCFNYIKQDIMKCVRKPNHDEEKMLIDQINDTKSKIVKHAIYYMIDKPNTISNFDEIHIKNDIINFWSNEENNHTEMITSDSDFDGLLMRKMVRIISGSSLEDEFIDSEYKRFINDINEYEKLAYKILDSDNQSYLSSFLSLIQSATSIGFQVNSAVVQLYAKLIPQCDNILTNMVLNYAHYKG